jgi:hypothetical protein
MSIWRAMIAVALLLWVDTAHSHGIAGNRYFAGTLTFDDPAVADEAILPGFANLKHPAQGGNVDDTRFNWSFCDAWRVIHSRLAHRSLQGCQGGRLCF